MIEYEIEAIIAGVGLIEESHTVEVLAMTQEKCGLQPTGTVKSGIAASNHKTASRQDLARLAGRTRCCNWRG